MLRYSGRMFCLNDHLTRDGCRLRREAISFSIESGVTATIDSSRELLHTRAQNEMANGNDKLLKLLRIKVVVCVFHLVVRRFAVSPENGALKPSVKKGHGFPHGPSVGIIIYQ